MLLRMCHHHFHHSHQFDPTKCQQNMHWVKVERRKEAANSWLKNIAGKQQTALTPCCPLCRGLLIRIAVVFIAEIAACSLIKNKIDFPFSFSISHMPVCEYGCSRHMLCSPHNLKLVTVLAAPALIPLALLWSWCLRHWVMPRCLEQNPVFFCAQGEQDHVLCWPDCLTMLCWVCHYSTVCEQSYEAGKAGLKLSDGARCWNGLGWFNQENRQCSCHPSLPLPPVLDLKLSKPRIAI